MFCATPYVWPWNCTRDVTDDGYDDDRLGRYLFRLTATLLATISGRAWYSTSEMSGLVPARLSVISLL